MIKIKNYICKTLLLVLALSVINFVPKANIVRAAEKSPGTFEQISPSQIVQYGYSGEESNAIYTFRDSVPSWFGTTLLERWSDEDLVKETPEFSKWIINQTVGTSLDEKKFNIYESESPGGQYLLIPIDKITMALHGDAHRPYSLNEITTPTGEPIDPEKLITKGWIWGAVYPSDEWGTDAEKVIKNGKVTLFRHVGTAKSQVNINGKGGGDGARNISNDKTDDGGYIFNRFTIKDLGGEGEEGGLYEGTYTLLYSYSEKGDIWGDAKANFWEQVSTVEFTGSVTFDLIHNSDDSGTIKYLENDGTHESNSKTNLLAMETNPGENGIFIDVKETSAVDNILDNALIGAANTIASMVTKLIAWASEMIHGMLLLGNEIENSDGAPAIWKGTRDIALSLLTLVLLLIAFANILLINNENYAVTRMVPKIIFAIIMTYFSYLIAAFLLDMMSAFQALLVNASDGAYVQLGYGINTKVAGSMADAASAMASILGLIIIAIMVAIALFWLLLVLIVRNAMLFVLVAVAPIAFMANILPFTEKYYQQWWAAFWRWGFIGPAVTFMLWLAAEFLNGYGEAAFRGNESKMTEAWLWLVAAAVIIFLAASLPLKMGGEVYGSIQKGWGNKHNPIKNRLDMRAANKDEERKNKLREKQAKLAQKRGGKFLTGMNKGQAAAARAGLKGDMEKEMSTIPLPELQKTSMGTGLEAEVAQDMLAGMGRLDLTDAAFAQRMVERSKKDGAFAGKLRDMKDFSAQAALGMASGGSTYTSSDTFKYAMEETNKAIAEGNAKDLTAAHFKAAHQLGGTAGRAALDKLRNDQYRSESFMKDAKGKDAAEFGRVVHEIHTNGGGISTSQAARDAARAYSSNQPGPGAGFDGMGPGAGI